MSKKMFAAASYGIVTSFIIILIAALILATLLKLTPMAESALGIWPMILSFVALFIGGIFSGAKLKEKGIVIGAFTGLLYSLLIFIIMFLGYDHSLTLHQILIGGV